MEPIEYFSSFLSRKNIIIKVTEADLILIPEMDKQHGGIGFNCHANAIAKGIKGRIDITARFKFPEGHNICFTKDDKILKELVDSLEFIKSTDRYPMHETVDNFAKNKNG